MEKGESSALNVTEIMAGIRAEIKEKGLTGEMLSFDDIPLEPDDATWRDRFDSDALHNDAITLQENAPIESRKGNVFSRALMRIMRHPLADRADCQNKFNATTADAVTQIERYIRASRAVSEASLCERIEALELQQRNARHLIAQQQAEITALQEKLARREDS